MVAANQVVLENVIDHLDLLVDPVVDEWTNTPDTLQFYPELQQETIMDKSRQKDPILQGVIGLVKPRVY